MPSVTYSQLSLLLLSLTQNEPLSFHSLLEQIKSFIVAEEPFSVENGLVTPTQKKRRAFIQKKYQDKLEELYKE